MPSSPLFDRSVTVAGKTYPELTKDVADYPERLTDTEASVATAATDITAIEADVAAAETDIATLEAGKRLLVFLGTISSKASDAAVAHGLAPVAGTIVAFKTVLLGALATADATFQGQVNGTNSGSTTTGLVTAAESGSAAGDIDSAAPLTTNITVVENDKISMVCGGGSTATADANCYAVIAY